MAGQSAAIMRGMVWTILSMGLALPLRAELVGYWPLDGTLDNLAQPIPRGRLLCVGRGRGNSLPRPSRLRLGTAYRAAGISG